MYMLVGKPEYRVKTSCQRGVGMRVVVKSLSDQVTMGCNGLEVALAKVINPPQTLREMECRRINCFHWLPELGRNHNVLTGLMTKYMRGFLEKTCPPGGKGAKSRI